MEKSISLNLRINPTVKKSAEEVLSQLGMSMSTAIDIYLRQISLTGGIPFSVSLPKAPASINAETMTADQIRDLLEEGFEDMRNGNVQDASIAFKKFKDSL